MPSCLLVLVLGPDASLSPAASSPGGATAGSRVCANSEELNTSCPLPGPAPGALLGRCAGCKTRPCAAAALAPSCGGERPGGGGAWLLSERALARLVLWVGALVGAGAKKAEENAAAGLGAAAARVDGCEASGPLASAVVAPCEGACETLAAPEGSPCCRGERMGSLAGPFSFKFESLSLSLPDLCLVKARRKLRPENLVPPLSGMAAGHSRSECHMTEGARPVQVVRESGLRPKRPSLYSPLTGWQRAETWP